MLVNGLTTIVHTQYQMGYRLFTSFV